MFEEIEDEEKEKLYASAKELEELILSINWWRTELTLILHKSISMIIRIIHRLYSRAIILISSETVDF